MKKNNDSCSVPHCRGEVEIIVNTDTEKSALCHKHWLDRCKMEILVREGVEND